LRHIKEPKGIDFVIASEPLTDKARKEINEFILNHKRKAANKRKKAGSTRKQTKAAHA
jgi:hypothetical protein